MLCQIGPSWKEATKKAGPNDPAFYPFSLPKGFIAIHNTDTNKQLSQKAKLSFSANHLFRVSDFSHPFLIILENFAPSIDASRISPLSPKTNAITGSLVENTFRYCSLL